MTESDSGIRCEFVDKRMIVSWKECTTLDGVTELTHHGTGDGIAVMSGCTTTCNTALTVTPIIFLKF